MGQQSFENKVALITGSSQGIGKAIAIEFINAGAHVIINGRNEERLTQTAEQLKSMGGNVLPVVADITDQVQVANLIDRAIAHFGRLDFLINNAGISMRGKFSELHPSVVESVFRINVFGTANLTALALPHLRSTAGSIVFISSVAGIRGLPFISVYGASKMALRGIAESIRIEEVDTGIHVGLIYVGFTEIEFEKETMGADGEFQKIPDRTGFKVQTKESVAKAVIVNIRKRKFISTLSRIGKLNAFVQSLMPWIVEKVLIRSTDKIEERT